MPHHHITKPLLACNEPLDLARLTYPILASPKLDGIRCIIRDGSPVSRTFKPIANRHIRRFLEEQQLPNGFDGELMTYEGTGLMMKPDNFQGVSSKVMSYDGKPTFMYNVFDWVRDEMGVSEPYAIRYANLLELVSRRFSQGTLENITIVPQHQCSSVEEVLAYEEAQLKMGHEGVILRSPLGRYKCGRSTLNEGILLKLKRFEDSEAKVIGFEQLMHNSNEATTDALGHTERSSHQAGMVGMGVLGALIVKAEGFADTFKIGTGFTAEDREVIWKMKESYVLRLAKFKFQSFGTKDKPRCPVFIGWRDKEDM